MKFLVILAACLLAAEAAPKKSLWRPTTKADFQNLKTRNIMQMQALSFVKPKKPSPLPTTPVSAISAPRQADCGLENTKSASGKIVGGAETNPNQFPWVSALNCVNTFFCTSSIVNENWILTAAHCVDGCNNGWDVTVGVHDLSRPESTAQTIHAPASNGMTHPLWDAALIINDIALVRLPEAIEFSDVVRPSCMVDSGDIGDDLVGQETTCTGWGKLSDSPFEGRADKMHFVRGRKIITNEECAGTYGSTITDGHVCIDTSDGKGVCSGDSGGPLNLQTASGQYKTVGVTSFVSGAGCASGYPHGFTRTTAYLDWILDNTR
ncbi:hypothetical protein TCAL_00224 [Tigriopus californicus]|uniref:Peptidase S1 domain-containing protein n=1 Tax=Tigriopus californicus TaxID=6832 RepID=A0A553P1F0_TIGCA|nr:brachyurin-like [Tigriopus californicus]TRY71518.1 hypothetical protein TCAL_00224 [Tigriopus californicus]